jgi:hypothetical protein
MEYFTTKIVDQPVADKVNLQEINRRLAAVALPERFAGAEKLIVTVVAREPDDFEFDAWRRNGKIFVTLPLVYEEVLRASAEEIIERCGQLFEAYLGGLEMGD